MNEPFLTHARFVKQTGGCCLFAVVVLAWHPAPSLVVENGTARAHFPPEFFPAVKEGIESLLSPDTCARVILVDGLSHAVDSNAISFRAAGKMAAREAVERLNFSPRNTPHTPREIALQWEQTQAQSIQKVRVALNDQLKSFHYHQQRDIWWRESLSLEHLVRLGTNTRFVPTTLDLHLAFSVPELLQILEVETWRESSGGPPQEIGSKRLSTLAGTAPFPLHQSPVPTLLEALRNHGLDYLDTCTRPKDLLQLHTYMDAGTQSALHYLCGEKELARQKASQGLKNALGNPGLSRACERVLGRL